MHPKTKSNASIAIFLGACILAGAVLANYAGKYPILHNEPADEITTTLVIYFYGARPESYCDNATIWEGNDPTPISTEPLENRTIWEFRNVTFKAGTPWDQLETASDLIDFSWDASYYPSFKSYLITSIAGVKNGQSNTYWLYWVNGEFAPVGVNLYNLENKDVVEWKFVESAW